MRSFADCDGTVNNSNYDRYVAIDSINFDGLKQISDKLNEFGIFNRIYKVQYKERNSYRLKISKRENLLKFNNLIGFSHPLKQEKLNIALILLQIEYFKNALFHIISIKIKFIKS
ncbi:LAGLIDADG family homing endonuclease [Candidatus Pacearchaeota archaeon]|nr:LAGLIDADG family homing endonuclease [Candidatus Pacearchaeota archaeon]